MVCETIRTLDVDNHGGVDGHVALAAIELEHGKIETWMVRTPRSGRHYHFSRSKADVSVLAKDGIELRGDGHYVLLPGSSTPDGTYRWDEELNPHTVPRMLVPEHVLAYFTGAHSLMETPRASPPEWQLETPLRGVSRFPAEIHERLPWPNGSRLTCRKAAATRP
jgi:Bifunctional DNA primase/polymerase, N-terminal